MHIVRRICGDFFYFFIVYKLDITNLWGSNSCICNNRRYII